MLGLSIIFQKEILQFIFTAYDLSVVSSLKENSTEVARDACDILLKLLGNVLRDPQNFKYRTIR